MSVPVFFDSLVGANDRHPKNWGLIYDAVKNNGFRFAPVFDTARGLFWNYSDEQLAIEDKKERRTDFIESYANRSRPFVSVETLEKTEQLNHFDVIKYAMELSEYKAPIRQVIRAFRPKKCAKMLHQRFGRLLSRRRLEYIDELLHYRHDRLRSICGL